MKRYGSVDTKTITDEEALDAEKQNESDETNAAGDSQTQSQNQPNPVSFNNTFLEPTEKQQQQKPALKPIAPLNPPVPPLPRMSN